MSVASGNPTIYSNDTGITLLSTAGVVSLTGTSIALSGYVTSTGSLTVPALAVTGVSALQNVTTKALTATTGSFSGSLSTASSATVTGTLTVSGTSNLAAANLTGALSVAGSSALQGPVICSAAVNAQSLTVVAAAQLQSSLAVGGASAFTGAATFLAGLTCAANTAIAGYDVTASDNVTVGNALKVNSTLQNSVQLVNPSATTGQTLQLSMDRTAASSSCSASFTLSPAGGLAVAAGGKTALSVGTADQSVIVTAYKQGDTFRVAGDGTISSTTELTLDNTAKAAGQITRVGTDASGWYLSPGSLSKTIVLNYAGLLAVTKGLQVTNGLTSDSVTATNLTATNASLASATLGSLNCNSLTAASGSPLTLYGGDNPKTVTVPGAFLASTINGLASTAITLTGSDTQKSTVVSGRLQVDSLLVNAASSITVVSPAIFQSSITGPTATLANLQIVAPGSSNALATYDATASASGFIATAGMTPTGYQLSVSGAVVYAVTPSTKLTTFSNSVQLNSTLSVAGPATFQSTLTVGGPTVFASSVTPQTNNALNLGSSASRWANLYIAGTVVLPNATFTGKLSELTPDSLTLQGQESINFAGPRGLVIKNTSTTTSSTADIVFDRTAISNSQIAGIGLTGDSGGLYLSTNSAQRVNIGIGGLVGVGGVTGVSPLTLAASTTASGYTTNSLYMYNGNTSSTASSPQNCILTTQVQSQNTTALAYHCFDNTSFSWSIGMRGNDSKLYMAPSNSGPYTSQKLSLDQSGNMVIGGGLLIGDGSVTLPAYGFTSDNRNDTGFYHPSEGVIGVANNGVQSMSWNSDTSISMLGNVSVASNLTTAGLSVNGYAGINTLSVNQTTTLTGALSVASTSSLIDTVITSPTTTTSMFRLVGTSSSQAEASMAFNRTGTMSIVWNMGQGCFTTTDDFCIGGGSGQGPCLQIGAANGFVSMRHSYGTSDRNQKKDIQECSQGLAFICDLKPVQYRWKEGGDGKAHWGFVAQDVESIVSQEDGVVGEYVANGVVTKSLAYTELIAPMAKAIQELQEQVQQLQKQLTNQIV